MQKILIRADELSKAIQLVIGAADKKQSNPILSYLLFSVEEDLLTIIATDMDIQLKVKVFLIAETDTGQMTVSAKRLLDICRTLPGDVIVAIQPDKKDDRLKLEAAGTRVFFSTLPSEDFPLFEEEIPQWEGVVRAGEIRKLLEKTAFAISLNDVRFYLNGLMMSLEGTLFSATASNGHRLAYAVLTTSSVVEEPLKFVLPRKTVYEAMSLLGKIEDDTLITLQISARTIVFSGEFFSLRSKLVETPFPDISKVIPQKTDRKILIDRDEFKLLLQRAAIFADEKLNSIRMEVFSDHLRISASNQDQELLEEEMAVDYQGEKFEANLNIRYLQDLLSVQPPGKVACFFGDDHSGLVVESSEDTNGIYLIMPMRV